MTFLNAQVLIDNYVPLVLVSVVFVVFTFYNSRPTNLDPREPPLVNPTIPVIGHMVGLFRYQKEYYNMLSKRCSYPAFTLSIFWQKFYVLATPELTQAAIRAKTLDFGPLHELGLKLFDLSEESSKMFLQKPDNGEQSYIQRAANITHETLSLGPALDEMNARMLNKIASTLNTIPESLTVERFYLWLRHMFTLATCSSIFGDHDPFSADLAVEDALWDFDDDVVRLLPGRYTSIIARKGNRARKTVQAAFIKYLEAGYHHGTDVSTFYRARAMSEEKIGLSIPERAKIPISFAFAAMANAVPTLYWIIIYVFSNPALVEELRNEVSGIVSVTGMGANRKFRIDVTRFSSDLPLLSSVYQEVLRLTNTQVSARVVQTDTLLSAGEESYLLKQGAMVQLPTAPLHSSASVWGTDADKFDPRRFLEKGNKERRSAWMPFGGGKNLCPGRHFAAAEILGVTTALIMGFRILDTDSGPVAVSTKISHGFVESTGRPIGPAEAMSVKMVRREGMEHAIFEFKTKA